MPVSLLAEATIYAFEPQEECVAAIERGCAGAPNLHAIRTAVGAEDGEVTFHRNAFSQASSILEMTDLHKEAFPWASESQKVCVPIHRLDSLQSELSLTPSILVKIDVQGYEDRVLRGGGQVIRQADYVLIETAFQQLYDGEATFGTVHDVMTGYGFRYAGSLDQAPNPETGLPLYADALFVRQR